MNLSTRTTPFFGDDGMLPGIAMMSSGSTNRPGRYASLEEGSGQLVAEDVHSSIEMPAYIRVIGRESHLKDYVGSLLNAG